ncbi:MAG: metallophosphoesterase, partial [Desulfuromonadaceae bacterium]|nr:metallophosphoesterase [Desulfuromonadaceae bacterium]
IEKIKSASPDIIVSTGDMVDGKLNHDETSVTLNPLAAILSGLSAPYGKFGVVGNHEVYAGVEQSTSFTNASGFKMLRNERVETENCITIAGVDDLAVNVNNNYNPRTETELLNSLSKKRFNILLKHRPDIVPSSDALFDLQLSGHVHGGQIFPFNFIVKLKHAIPCGTTTTKRDSIIYVSRGTGTWGPPMRLFAPPELTIIDIVKQ